jgi:hypothetical protein
MEVKIGLYAFIFASGYPQVGIAQPSFGEPHTIVYSRKCGFHEGVVGKDMTGTGSIGFEPGA